MYAKMAKLPLDEVPMQRLLIRFKDQQNRTHIKFMKDAIQSALEKEGLKDQFTIWNYMDTLDTSRSVSTPSLFFTNQTFNRDRLRKLWRRSSTWSLQSPCSSASSVSPPL